MTKYVFIGFMGAGKTTIGRQLAHIKDWPFYDMDEVIVQQAGCPVSDYFDRYGEQSFRQLEVKVLNDLLSKEGDAVISTGGGTVMMPAAQQALKDSDAEVIWLNTPFDVLCQRLEQDTVQRPLFVNSTPESFYALYEKRLPTYQNLADHVLDVEQQQDILTAEN